MTDGKSDEMPMLIPCPCSPMPVLFAVDQVNALYALFDYFDTESKRLAASDMPVLAALTKYFDSPSLVQPGSAVVGALSYTDTRIWSSTLRRRLAKPLASESHGHAHELISVPPFSKEETGKVLKYYRALGLLYEGKSCFACLLDSTRLDASCYRVMVIVVDAIDGNYCDTKYYVSGGNGRKLFLSCSLDNIY